MRRGRAGLCLSLLLVSACVWRGERTHHYLGPVALRYTEPCRAGAGVIETGALGLLGELGRPSGISLGLFDRIAAWAPPGPEACARETAAPRWHVLLGIPRLRPGRWTISLLYARADDVPRPTFVMRRLAGAQVTAGEGTALTLGLVTRTLFTPPADAVSWLHFDGSRPLEMRLATWTVTGDQPLPTEEILSRRKEALDEEAR